MNRIVPSPSKCTVEDTRPPIVTAQIAEGTANK